MARYLTSRRDRRRSRNRRWVYVISALVIVIGLYFVYRIVSRGRQTKIENVTDASMDNEALTSAFVSLPPEPNIGLSVATDEHIDEPNSKAAGLIDEALALINGKPARIIDARDRLNEILLIPMSRQQRKFVKEQLSKLAEKWLFSRTIYPGDRLCKTVQVQPGSLLSTISKQYRVPYEILMEINGIKRAETLRAGDMIKVINGPFHARVYRSTFTMDLYLQNTFVRSFPVGLGKPGRETPTGFWVVEPGGKLIKPTWRDPDTGKTYEADSPDYPLGSRWIRLKGLQGEAVGRTGIAFHGTKDPNLIGTAGSRGCIRLYNGDVILIYNLLMPGLSRVEVVE